MDIPALARNGVDVAWKKAVSVLSVVTSVRDNPNTTRDPITEEETTTWGIEHTTAVEGTPLLALLYKSKEDRPVTDDASRPRLAQMAMFRAVDLPGVAQLTTKAELVISGTTWKVMEADAPPGEAIHLLRIAQ